MPPQTRRTSCSFPDCGKKVVAHGLCTGHNRQRSKGMDLQPIRVPRPDSAPGYHWCSRCKLHRPVEDFGEDAARGGLKRVCRSCGSEVQQAYARRNAEAVALGQLLRKYGLTEQQHAALLEAQGGLCAICDAARVDGGRRFAVDHDHVSGAVRGLLCGPCNTGLGHFRDNAALLEAAAVYLRAGGAGGPAAQSGVSVLVPRGEPRRAGPSS